MVARTLLSLHERLIAAGQRRTVGYPLRTCGLDPEDDIYCSMATSRNRSFVQILVSGRNWADSGLAAYSSPLTKPTKKADASATPVNCP